MDEKEGMKKYNVEELQLKSIFEMRALAKQAGVSAPTKLNKDVLIDYVYRISNGLMDPPKAPRRGRPRKSEAAIIAEETTIYNGNQNEVKKNEAQKKDGEKYDSEVQPQSQPQQQRSENHKPDITVTYRPYKFEEGESHIDRTPTRKPVRTSVLRDAPDSPDQIREGYLEVNPDGYGFLRVKNGEFHDMDAYVSSAKIKQFALRRGDYVKAVCKTVQENRPAAVFQVTSINGESPLSMAKRPNFDEMVPIYPNERIRLERGQRDYATRCIDLVSPIGKGQRGIIVSPPKAGKTTLLKMIASSIAENYPDVELKVLLIDERPEEVTDMQRSIKGEVVYSTFDELPEHHTKTAELLLDRAKRLVEMGKDVVILLDSLTRLARAYNLTIPPTGRTLSGGIDPGALHTPKRFFGSARNIEHGGSLTIIATALIDTGSRMDDVIFEEFKGTGNMEIHLDRNLSEKRIFPAIDLAKSGTRKEELLLTPSELEGTWAIRRLLAGANNVDATSNLIGMLVKSANNKEFIEQLNLQLRQYQKEGYSVRSNKLN